MALSPHIAATISSAIGPVGVNFDAPVEIVNEALHTS
jgi:hypothetical protein